MIKFLVVIIFYSCLTHFAVAKGVYQSAEQFIQQSFVNDIPAAKVVWITAQDKDIIAEIMGHDFERLRVRYWQKTDETVWILDEIGKEKPITIGVHIQAQHIVTLKVLAFRESRGDEVRHDFFTTQFQSVELTSENKLNRHIDGITGATMSVRALTKVARLALWLNQKVAKS